MLLTPFVRWQLRVFSVAAVVGAIVLALYFVRLPQLLGFGQYDVTANFEAGAGLYSGAQVTYHGAPIGRVASLEVAASGVNAKLHLDEDVKVPSDVTAEIHSMSAVGEQYVDLVPPPDSRASALTNGAVIPSSHTSAPVQIGPVLDNVARLVGDIPSDKLNSLLHSSSQALNGAGTDVGALIDNGTQLLTAAQAHLQPTRDLISGSQPLMNSVNSTADDVRKFSANLATITAELRAGNSDLQTLVNTGAPFAATLSSFLNEMNTPTRELLGAALPITKVLALYNPALSALLSYYPKTVAALQAIMVPYEKTHEIRIAVGNIDMPPACTEGYLPQSQQRPLNDTSHGDAPFVYCKAPSNSVSGVRGVRNVPCATDPSRRAALASDCPK